MQKRFNGGLNLFLSMTGKEKYITPVVLQRVSLFLEGALLAGSVVTKSTTIQSTGQEVHNYDFADPSNGFNADWE